MRSTGHNMSDSMGDLLKEEEADRTVQSSEVASSVSSTFRYSTSIGRSMSSFHSQAFTEQQLKRICCPSNQQGTDS